VDRDLRPVRALALYLLAVFLGGALLAPWLFHAVQALAGTVPALERLAGMPFARYVNRALLIVALLGLPFFVRGSGIRSWRAVGVPPGLIRWRAFGVAFAIGFLSLAAVCAVALLGGGRELRARTPGELLGHLLGALATALVVAVIEELLFRGAMFGGLRRATGWVVALAVSSTVYAIVHFLGRPANPEVIDALSGVRVLPSMLAAAGNLQTLIPAFLNLTLAGAILALAFHRSGDLSASIGIHAGWILWLRYYGYVTEAAEGADPWFWGTRALVDGWLASVALVLVLVAVVLRPPRGVGVRSPGLAGAARNG
jgi:uncharacterized protein